ncbi:MAG TPA: hypothetical protein VF326_05525 [Anaerolineaceae bacterium]|jgi:hypothetical protein
MASETRISPKYLAQVLGVPGYLFSDLSFIRGTLLQNGWVEVNDPSTPAINGTILAGEAPGPTPRSALFIPRLIRVVVKVSGH